MSAFDRLHEAGRAQWPHIEVPAIDFAHHLSGHLGVSSETAEALSMHAGDLYIAFAASRGDPAAISVIERTCIAQVHLAIRGILAVSEIDDLKQQLRQRLFVGTNNALPKILDYAGRGELRAWVRASAVRAAISVLRSQKREQTREHDLWFAAPGIGIDPTIEHLRPRLRTEFRAAFEAAVEALEVRARNLLKQHFLDGLSVDELAALYRVHRATAFRWLTRARGQLLARTRRALADRLALGRSELDSVMRLVDSQLGASMVRILAGAELAGPSRSTAG